MSRLDGIVRPPRTRAFRASRAERDGPGARAQNTADQSRDVGLACARRAHASAGASVQRLMAGFTAQTPMTDPGDCARARAVTGRSRRRLLPSPNRRRTHGCSFPPNGAVPLRLRWRPRAFSNGKAGAAPPASSRVACHWESGRRARRDERPAPRHLQVSPGRRTGPRRHGRRGLPRPHETRARRSWPRKIQEQV